MDLKKRLTIKTLDFRNSKMQKKKNNLSAGQTFASAVASRDDQHLIKQDRKKLLTHEIMAGR